jgi:hypothetical protein
MKRVVDETSDRDVPIDEHLRLGFSPGSGTGTARGYLPERSVGVPGGISGVEGAAIVRVGPNADTDSRLL